jgi:hypothetical protein
MKVVIVHGSNPRDEFRLDSSEYIPQNVKNWIPWIKNKLEEKGIECINPLMPKSWAPIYKYKEWKEEFEEINLNAEKLILIAPAFLSGEGTNYL